MGLLKFIELKLLDYLSILFALILIMAGFFIAGITKQPILIIAFFILGIIVVLFSRYYRTKAERYIPYEVKKK